MVKYASSLRESNKILLTQDQQLVQIDSFLILTIMHNSHTHKIRVPQCNRVTALHLEQHERFGILFLRWAQDKYVLITTSS